VSHHDIGKIAFDAIRDGDLKSVDALVGKTVSGDIADAAAAMVLQHSSMRAVMEECANK
jgi:hypothetical protein